MKAKRKDIFDGCNNMFGPIDPNAKHRIRRFLIHPTSETWDRCYSLIIGGDGFTTFWQAVSAVNPSFPRSTRMDPDTFKAVWEEIPDAFTAHRALKYARELERR